ncbi:hypothetical protein GCM10007977_082650 [Dactylosporangium sucinum]|uniref:Uncharacterized protein n=1 Tax=Dactylosporangium sucinum TaxID=1424081 RepID=A0A917UBD4_9ACTN|nr:hypothetical protein GCM10007977_082650 [Dactylosporangium sucinum]
MEPHKTADEPRGARKPRVRARRLANPDSTAGEPRGTRSTTASVSRGTAPNRGRSPRNKKHHGERESGSRTKPRAQPAELETAATTTSLLSGGSFHVQLALLDFRGQRLEGNKMSALLSAIAVEVVSALLVSLVVVAVRRLFSRPAAA